SGGDSRHTRHRALGMSAVTRAGCDGLMAPYFRRARLRDRHLPCPGEITRRKDPGVYRRIILHRRPDYRPLTIAE
ncbi:MAG: hypothetical protein WBQ78_15695, partial [Gammaproteobacteria bacterium]